MHFCFQTPEWSLEPCLEPRLELRVPNSKQQMEMNSSPGLSDDTSHVFTLLVFTMDYSYPKALGGAFYGCFKSTFSISDSSIEPDLTFYFLRTSLLSSLSVASTLVVNYRIFSVILQCSTPYLDTIDFSPCTPNSGCPTVSGAHFIASFSLPGVLWNRDVITEDIGSRFQQTKKSVVGVLITFFVVSVVHCFTVLLVTFPFCH